MYSCTLISLLVSALALSASGAPSPTRLIYQAWADGASSHYVTACMEQPQVDANAVAVDGVCSVTLVWLAHFPDENKLEIPAILQYTFQGNDKQVLPTISIRKFDRRERSRFVLVQTLAEADAEKPLANPLLLGYLADVAAWEKFLDTSEQQMRRDSRQVPEYRWLWNLVYSAVGERGLIRGQLLVNLKMRLIEYHRNTFTSLRSTEDLNPGFLRR
ncbi:MAG: hypothetical protein M1829_002608 [Trizodia sp. TS-e1964]|nr:MAG: hypothetical protein M1829_002608 [Trizodia sp. TS-e1964]